MARRKVSWLVWLRRLCQACFMLLFLYLFEQAVYHPINETGRHVKLFFQLDPLILLSSWLSSHQILSGLLLSIATLVVTLVIGRWFCGWICPFGALHTLFSSLRRQTTKEKLTSGGYSKRQKSKYYLLAALLAAALLGVNLAGWFDPFSVFYRSMAVAVYPTASDGVKSLFTWIYQTDPGMGKLKLTAITEPIYEVLRRSVLPTTQPHFFGMFLVAMVFLTVALLNLYRARFWCKYICPLGALLGVVGKNPLIQIKRKEELCNSCRLCVSDCQGGANPDVPNGWKPSECLYCLNCQSTCPHHAISFGLQVPGGKK